jgi:hypothetical protein
MRTRLAVATLALMLLTAARAEARHVHFLGPHPIAAKYGGGYCYIETPHLHAYAPEHAALYQQVGDQYVFTGDPTPFGYDGEKHPFYGHHPVVTVGTEPVYCYINGPHFHAFAAPALPDYQVRDGVAFYVGAYPPSYAKLKPARARLVNAEYRPYAAFRPTVTVAPPPAWQGEVWVAPPAVAVRGPGAQVAVGAPGVYVAPPHVEVAVSAPGVYVAPPSAQVGVVVGAPGEVIVEGGGHGHWRHEERREERREERHEERREEHWHHDNGKHKGWGKH